MIQYSTLDRTEKAVFIPNYDIKYRMGQDDGGEDEE
jgi:hypothetical protein